MSDMAINLGKEIFKHQMTKSELLEVKVEIENLREQLKIALEALADIYENEQGVPSTMALKAIEQIKHKEN